MKLKPPATKKMTREVIRMEEGEKLRFGFGQNWFNFLTSLTPNRIKRAEESLIDFLDVKRLDGRVFLDIGCGSGLFSLAARNLGAHVISMDLDPQSVVCTKRLKEQYYASDVNWEIEHGSILNEEFADSLPIADIVYSWGVLHHTGRQWDAIHISMSKIAPNGLFFIALYNDQGIASTIWWTIKVLYNWLPRPFRFLVILPCGIVLKFPIILRDALKFCPFKSFRNYSSLRGMSAWHDLIDWIGGFPFEVSSPSQVIGYFKKHNFSLERIKDVGTKLGCNEFLFRKQAN